MKKDKKISIIKYKHYIFRMAKFFSNIIFSPMKAGLMGFAILFTINLLLSFIKYLNGEISYVYVDKVYLANSLPGFFIFYILGAILNLIPFLKRKLQRYSAFQFFSSLCQF